MALQLKSVLCCHRGQARLGAALLAGRDLRAVRVPRRVEISRQISNAVKDDDGEDPNLTGEWPPSWSVNSYEDVEAYSRDKLLKEEGMGKAPIVDVMSKELTLATPDTPIKDVEQYFDKISGLPVVNNLTEKKLVGILSKKDLQKGGSLVKDVMSTPPVYAKPSNKVADAAILMLKYKVHRIPIVEADLKVVGIVTRTDIFTALEAAPV